MALTKITGQVINTATDVTVGVLTVTNTLSVGGTVSVGGTLTYEDVTNVDSVGIITARSNILVGSGITLSPDGNVFATGVSTFRGELRLTEGTSSTSNGDEIGSLMYLHPASNNKNAKIVGIHSGGSSGADLAFFTRTQADGSNTDGGEERLRITSTGDIFTSGDRKRDGARLTITKNATGFTTAISLHNGSGTGTKITSTKSIILGADYDADSGVNASFISFETDATEKARVASGGQLLIGDDTARLFDGGNTPLLQVASNTSGVWARISSTSYLDSGIGGGIILANSRNGTVGSHTIVQDDDKLGSIFFEGSDGTQFARGAQIESYVDGTPGTDDMPGRIEFSTTPDGSTTPTTNLVIDSSGRLIAAAGRSTPRTNYKDTNGDSSTPSFQFETANDDSASSLSLTYGRNNSNGAELKLAKHRAATIGGNTVVQTDDELGCLSFLGNDGTNFIPAASIRGVVNLAPGTNDMPGAIRFGTTADGAAVTTDHWQINRTGVLDQLNSGAGIRFLHGHSVTPNDLEAVLSNIIDDFESGDLDWEIHKDNGLTTGTNASGAHAKYVKIGPVVHIFGWIRTDGNTSTNNRTAVMTDGSGNRAQLPFTPNGTVMIPVNFTRSFQNSTTLNGISLGATHANDDLYIHGNQSNQYTPASDNCVLTNQTNLVIAFNGSYYTFD